MDDSCAVCAESLEWVSYGACGHKEVCSTCVARLRFICDDQRCCICKSISQLVFVTKALGDYTRMINDFSLFPSELKEGRVGGSYWYHEHTQSLFDDFDHYKMIKEMCRLSCSVCDNNNNNNIIDHADDSHSNTTRRRPRFRNIDQLKGHLFHQHRTLMCSLCLEGRKVFICEQKLYTRTQLNQHIHTGDSEVDGTESDRGGFMGHPICDFCKTPFYGDNELFSHMSTEHFTCHLCRRQHPGQYDYFKNYDDLENHFRGEHFLCEDEACLAKKFIVFTSESEIKRHNAIEHGGSMSRSKRNAALQIPTSFRYQRGSEQSSRRGRGNRTFHRDYSEDQLPSSYEASYDTANDVDQLVQPLESLTTTDSSRYMLAVSSLTSRNAPLEESSFPPLPAAPKKSKHGPEKLKNSMASHLRQKSNANVGVSRPSVGRTPQVSSSKPMNANFSSNNFPELPTASSSSPSTGPINNKFSSNSFPGLSAKPSSNGFPELPGAGGQNKTIISNTGNSAKLPTSYSSLAKTVGSSSRIHHSTSAPNLAAKAAVDTSSTSDFPPVSAVAQVRKLPISGHEDKYKSDPRVEAVQTANKSLIETIRSALDFDEDKYTTFKLISGEYRQGMIDAETYLSYVDQFGLLHLLLDLARLCPDPERQTTLISTYNANMRSNSSSNTSKKGKGKCIDVVSSSRDKLADSIIDKVRNLQGSYKPSEEDAEVLSKDGYRDSKGKGKIMAETSLQPSQPLNTNLGDGGGKGKKQKKTSKFHRVRLGDGSMEALLDLKNSDPDPDLDIKETTSSDGLAVRGAWRNGGGQKLVSLTSKVSKK